MTADALSGMSSRARKGADAVRGTHPPVMAAPGESASLRRLRPLRLRGLSPVTEGLVGSLMVAAGSYGVGWLVTVSPLNRLTPVILLRTEPAGVVVCTLLLTVGCWVMLRAWLRLADHAQSPEQSGSVSSRQSVRGQGRSTRDDAGLRTVTRAAMLWSVPQLLALPIFSRDVFAYLNQGRLVLAGENPYTTGVSFLENWFQLGTDIIWAEDPTPYGPLFLWYQAAVMQVAGESPDLALLLFRLSCVLGVGLLIIVVPKLAALCAHAGRPVTPARAQWLTVANPLLIISFISSAHNDALMIGLALVAVWAAARGRGVTAAAVMTLSIGVKPITLLLLPFIGLLWAVHRHRSRPDGAPLWRQVLLCWTATLMISAGSLGAVGLVQGYGFSWLEVLGGTGTGSVPWAPLGLLDGLLTGALTIAGTPSGWTLEVIRTAGRVLSVLVVLGLMLWPLRSSRTGGPGAEAMRTEDLRTQVLLRMTWALAAVVLLSPLIQPWYLLWLLPLFAVTGVRSGWPFGVVVGATGFFLAFGASDQLFVHQFVTFDLPGLDAGDGGLMSPELMLRLISLSASAVCALLLLFAGPRLHGALRRSSGAEAPASQGGDARG